MLVPRSWLAEYCGLDQLAAPISNSQLADAFNELGLIVEGYEANGEGPDVLDRTERTDDLVIDERSKTSKSVDNTDRGLRRKKLPCFSLARLRASLPAART